MAERILLIRAAGGQCQRGPSVSLLRDDDHASLFRRKPKSDGEARGGDLMMVEGPGGQTTEPDERHFALPVRRDHESVAQYLERLARATDDVRRHPPRAD